MNRAHNWYCNREAWKRRVREDIVPPALEGIELGDDVLEVGPGFGPGTDVLSARTESLTALELDPALAARLRDRFGDRVEVVVGDGTAMPFDSGSFSAAACFTMLHHVPSADLQDQLFAEVRRVLRPGGAFAGSDSVGNGIGFALIHIGDIKVLIDPETLPQRLEAAGFERVEVASDGETTRFRAFAPMTNAG